MIELNSTAAAPRRNDLTLWLAWIAATCGGVIAMTILVAAARSVPGPLVPLRAFLVVAQLPGMLVLSAAVQQPVLRLSLPGEHAWLRHTLRGVLIGIPVSVALALLVTCLMALAERVRWARTLPPGVVPGDASPGGLFLVIGIIMLAGVFLSAALAQWRVLRRHSQRAACWPPVSFLGWIFGLLAACKVMFPGRDLDQALAYTIFDQALSQEPPGLARMMASPILLGMVAGAITGLGLIYTLKARRPAPGRGLPPAGEDAR